MTLYITYDNDNLLSMRHCNTRGLQDVTTQKYSDTVRARMLLSSPVRQPLLKNLSQNGFGYYRTIMTSDRMIYDQHVIKQNKAEPTHPTQL